MGEEEWGGNGTGNPLAQEGEYAGVLDGFKSCEFRGCLREGSQ